MAEPISDARWAFLLERAGLDPSFAPVRFAELREGYAFLDRLQKNVRKKRDRAAEPAHIFVHPKG
jgi:hypothetical protein